MMVRLICVGVALGAIAAPARADVAKGVKASVGFATVPDFDTGVDDSGTFPKAAFGVTSFVSWSFHRYLALQPELSVVTKGMNIEESSMMSDGTVELTYLEFPVVMRANLRPGTSLNPYGYGGLFVAFLLDADAQFSDDSDTSELENDAEDGDLGIVGGAGVEFDVGSGHLLVEARFELGAGSTFDQGGGKNVSFGVLLGYSFAGR